MDSESLPPPIMVDRDIAFLLRLPSWDPGSMEPTYQRTPQENQVPMLPARVHQPTQTADLGTTQVPTPPAPERSM